MNADFADASQPFNLIGYLCPQCPSAPDPQKLIEALQYHNYTTVIIAFIQWNDDGSIQNTINDPNNPNFNFTADSVTQLKAQHSGRKVLVTLGGGAAGILNCGMANQDTFVKNMVEGLKDIVNQYGFDGVDFDMEHRAASGGSDYVKCGLIIANVVKQLHEAGMVTSIAPQMGNVNPFDPADSVSAGQNEHAPLLGMAMNCFSFISPQMYNTWAAVETQAFAIKYATALTQVGYHVTIDHKRYEVMIPASKLTLGYPATAKGASSGYIAPSSLHDIVTSLHDQGIHLGGMMTWSVGWDQQGDFEWVDTLSDLPGPFSSTTPAPLPSSKSTPQFDYNDNIVLSLTTEDTACVEVSDDNYCYRNNFPDTKCCQNESTQYVQALWLPPPLLNEMPEPARRTDNSAGRVVGIVLLVILFAVLSGVLYHFYTRFMAEEKRFKTLTRAADKHEVSATALSTTHDSASASTLLPRAL